jgi:uncharacterized protein YjbI with pentapeptide repeats
MTDSSLPKKKKKVTLKASELGIVKAKNALIRLGFESKSNFAASQLISRSTVTKFFQSEKIQLDSFKRICTALKLSWQEAAGMLEAEKQKGSLVLDQNISGETEEVGRMPTLRRQVTIVNPNSEKIKAVITLDGDVDSVDSWEIIQLLLRQNSGNSINIIDIESGSIRLTVEGYREDIQKLVGNIRLRELTELSGVPVENIEILTKNLDANKIGKWHLVKEIIDSTIIGRKLIGANLSDANLSGADLIGANLSDSDLSGTYLSGAYLNDADLSDANLSGADLIGANLIGANLSRANLIAANLGGADLGDANLSGADLIGANLSGTNLNGANLSGADLSGADLIGADLIGANLIGANLSHANLNGADLINANLSRANLIDANLSRADLSRADLSHANLNVKNVKNTRFVDNEGISSSLKLGLIKKGAMFEDSPGDRSGSYALR